MHALTTAAQLMSNLTWGTSTDAPGLSVTQVPGQLGMAGRSTIMIATRWCGSLYDARYGSSRIERFVSYEYIVTDVPILS